MVSAFYAKEFNSGWCFTASKENERGGDEEREKGEETRVQESIHECLASSSGP